MSEVLNQFMGALASGELKVVDLTQPLGPETPVIDLPPDFAASPKMTINEISRYDENGPAWYWNTLNLGEHTGTHFDAPVHWITGKNLDNNTCESIPAEQFVGSAYVIDVVDEVKNDPDFVLTAERIQFWEDEHGVIPAKSWVLLRTDWSKRTDPVEFLNMREDGPHSPGFHPSASQLLAHERDVLGVGVETVGTDAGQAGNFEPPFPSHNIMHGSGKFGLASLANLDQLPAKGALVIAAPLKIVGGSGSPLRVLAIIPA
jgi:kynurenine formamidase